MMDPNLTSLAGEVKEHLLSGIIPFWKNLKDEARGGFYGYVSFDLETDPEAEKGCILNSRILWFFSNVLLLYRKGLLTEEDFAAHGYSAKEIEDCARHAYAFLKDHCLDREHGGVYWSMKADGTPLDTTKHTYNQAFAIYALSSYCNATGDASTYEIARELYHVIEDKCTDREGYLEAQTVDFRPQSNEKLSENGIVADRTMNTLLHVFEAYSEALRVAQAAGLMGVSELKESLKRICRIQSERIYDPEKGRQEVFFDRAYHSMLDLYSYGHDIETAWLMDRGMEILGDGSLSEKMGQITRTLTEKVYETAFDGHSLANECDRGVVDETRIWWVQAETVVGFVNGYQKAKAAGDAEEAEKYLTAARNEWAYIREYVIDPREGSEWFWKVDPSGKPGPDRPMADPWKCPYHNGRMCMEVIRRAAEG